MSVLLIMVAVIRHVLMRLVPITVNVKLVTLCRQMEKTVTVWKEVLR